MLAAPALPPIGLPYRTPPQRSLSEMANQQLRRDRKDPLAQGVEESGRDDCFHPADKDKQVAIGGLLNAPVVAMRALTGNCPK